MLRLSFGLRGRPSKIDGLDRIRATYYLDGKRHRFDSDLRVHPDEWDNKQDKVKEGATKTVDWLAINKAIRGAKDQSDAIVHTSKEQRRGVTIKEANSFLAMLVDADSTRAVSEITFFEFFKARSSYKKFASNTHQKYLTVYREIQKRDEKLVWNKVTLKWCEDWIENMEAREMKESSIGKNVAVLKAVMHAGFEAQLHTNDAYKKFRADKVSTEPRPKVWLKPYEVQALKDAQLPRSTLEYARDYFMCGVLSGQRRSDWVKVMSNPASTTSEGTPIVKIVQQKTRQKVTINLCDTLLAIRERFANGYIPIVSDTTQRNHIKSLGELLKFESLKNSKFGTDPHLPDTHRRKQKEYHILSSHIGRRTFARTEWANGAPLSSIQIFLGHKKATQTTDYIGYDRDETQDMVADNRAKRLQQ